MEHAEANPMQRPTAGTTLIEVLVYAAVFMIVVGSMMTLAMAMLTGAERANSQIEVSDNARFLIQNIEFAIRNSSSVLSPFPGASGTTLTLNIDSNSLFQGHVNGAGWGMPSPPNPLTYSVVNGAMTMQFEGGLSFPITNSLVTIGSVSFSNNQYSTETISTIRIKAIVGSVDKAYPASVSIDFSVSLE